MDRKRNTKVRGRQTLRQKTVIDHRLGIPQWEAQVIRSFHIRYRATALSTVSFDGAELAAMCGVVATAATTSVQLSTAVRVKKIEMWGPVATAGTAVETRIDWQTSSTTLNLFSPGSTVSDSSISFDRPAYVCAKPPVESSSSKWQSSASTVTVCTIACPPGTILDFHLNFVINDNEAPVAGPALSGAVLGTIYHPVVNTNFQVVALNSI